MTYRIEIFRPHPDNDCSFSCARSETPKPAYNNLHYLMAGERPGTFALVIGIDGDEETVLERWRVAPDGRILRSVYDVRERELEQT